MQLVLPIINHHLSNVAIIFLPNKVALLEVDYCILCCLNTWSPYLGRTACSESKTLLPGGCLWPRDVTGNGSLGNASLLQPRSTSGSQTCSRIGNDAQSYQDILKSSRSRSSSVSVYHSSITGTTSSSSGGQSISSGST